MEIDVIAGLTGAPTEDGEIKGYSGTVIPYTLRLLPPGELDELRVERNRYLAEEQGIESCTVETAELFDNELRYRLCARAVCARAMPGEPLAPLQPVEVWRRSQGMALDTVVRHYTKLEALYDPVDEELDAQLEQVFAYVKKNGAGSAAYWRTIDYETLRSCFITLVRRLERCPSAT